MRRFRRVLSAALASGALSAALLVATPAAAATITVASTATPLGMATLTPSVNLTGGVLTLPASAARSAAVSSALSYFPTEGPTFAILSTGDAQQADDPNTNDPDGSGVSPDFGERSTGWSATPTPGRGIAYDTTTLRLDLNLSPTLNENCLLVDFAFYSEEYQEFVGQQYNDAFLAQLDSNVWSVGSGGVISAPGNFAFDPNTNRPVSVNGSGPTTMTKANAAGTTFDGATPLLSAATPAAPGAHSLYLTVFDAADNVFDSAVFFDNIRWIHVDNPTTDCRPGAIPANNRPTAVAGGPYTVLEGSTVALSAAGSSDPEDGTSLSYHWALGPDHHGTLDDPTSATPVFSATDDSSGPVTLTVADTLGATGTATASLTVANVAPTITSITGPTSLVNVGDPVQVSAVAVDPGTLDTHTWSINWGDGHTTPGDPGLATTATHQYLFPGDYTITLTVTDGDGGFDTQTLSAPVSVNHPPHAEANGPYAVVEGSSTMLDPWGSYDPEGGPLAYEWSAPSFGSLDDPHREHPTFTGIDDGNGALTLTVTDEHGATGNDSADVTVWNAAPLITALVTPTHQVFVGDPATVEAVFIDAGTADDHTWSVDFGDGSAPVHGSGPTVSATYAYTSPGSFTPTVTVRDDDGGVDIQRAAAPITVIANRPPVADAGGPYTVAEGALVGLTAASSSDPDGDPLTYTWSVSPASVGTLTSAVGEQVDYAGRDDGTASVAVTVTDPFGESDDATSHVTVTNVAPTITALTVPLAPAGLGSATALDATFTDPGVADTHTATVDWGDGSAPTTSSVSGGAVSASHTYGAPGVYAVTLTVTDDDGGSDTATATDYVVVYDPTGGFVTGGGWYDSPAGASMADPTATGKANFGFVAKYKKGATVPTGNTQFQFKAGDIDFHSVAYDWLVVSGSRARYKGTGTINGAGDYGFQLTATDGQVSGGGGTDRIRMKIWDRATGALVYDNQAGAADDAAASTTLGGGQITIHAAK